MRILGEILSNVEEFFGKKLGFWERLGKFKEDFKKRIILVLHGTSSCKNRIMVARMMLFTFKPIIIFIFPIKLKSIDCQMNRK